MSRNHEEFKGDWQTSTKRRKKYKQEKNNAENTRKHLDFDSHRDCIRTGSDSSSSSGRSHYRSVSLSCSKFKDQASINKEHSGKKTDDAGKRRNQSSDRLNEIKKEKHDEPHDRARRKYPMGYKKLESLSTKSPSEILQELANSHSGFEELLHCKELSFDQMYLIIKVLSKICQADFQRLVGTVLTQACVPDFVVKLRLFISSLAVENKSYRIEKIDSIYDNLLIFFQTVLKVLPRAAVEVLNELLRYTEISMKNVCDYSNVNVSEDYFVRLQVIKDDLKIFIEESKKRSEVKVKDQIFPEPLDNIQDISLYPEPNDIHIKPAPIRPNIVHGCYNNATHYLDIQFRLLREDFISPLRKGIFDFVHKSDDKKGKKYENIRIYKRVRFLKTKISMDKVGYVICFDVDNALKKINWEFSKRFMYGSLLLFTSNNFETFFMGTVINRDLSDLKNKLVTVQLVSVGNDNEDLLKCDYLMAESEVYFEPYFHVLRALQNMDQNNFPLEKYIVRVQTHKDVPLYMRNGLDLYEMKLKHDLYSFHILDDRYWPHWEELSLDKSQYLAFKAALTNELAVIQGPPGTGKTYIGLKIMETLLKNKIVWNQPQEVPILVVCYTNHALDQFLEGILKCTTNVVRIGGQSKNEILEPFNLKNRRRYYGYERGQSSLMNDLRKKMSTILNSIKSFQNALENMETNEGIISLKFLFNVLTLREKSCFNNNTNLIEWLLEEVLQNTNTEKSVDFIDEEYTFSSVINENNMDVLDGDEDYENLQRRQEMYMDTFELNNTEDATDFVKLSFACTIQNVEKKYCELVDKITDMINSQKPRRASDFKYSELKNLRKIVHDLQVILDYLKLKLHNKDLIKENKRCQLQACKDIRTLPYEDRWTLYRLWLERLKMWYKDHIRKQEILYRNDGLNFEEARQMEDLKVLKTADVVGITTTTAAKLQAMLRALQSKIVIIEEAAEVLEAHIVASLTSHCKHLVLIGDHKQLRPNPADYVVGKNLKLEISLFERFINNGIECYTLNIQHRMRPEISTLLVPTIYPKLLDHPSVQHRDKIKGIDKNVFFITHNVPEQEITEISSKQNKHEADFLIALCRHFLLQGYKPEDITILTTYSGQLYYLRNEKKKYNLPRELCIRVVDNFQGEESKIILLSLVRSNSENKVGFLKTENRVCVALSRARDGLYIIGNMSCLLASSELWQKIADKLTDQGSLGPFLTLRCEIHPDHITRVATANDFHKVSEGGCGQLCSQLLDCGHTCKSLCHVINKTHDLYTCREPCLRKCNNGHPCKLQCYEDCKKCNVPVLRTLPCGHVKEVPCHVSIENYICKVGVEVNYTQCKHTVKLPCFQRNTAACPAPCEFRLNCGHACERLCHVNEDPDHLEYLCTKSCARLRSGCSTAHNCRQSCFEECEPCKEVVVRELPCKHQVKLHCAADVSHYKCSVNVVKTVPECGHKVTVKCSEKPLRRHCYSDCQTLLPCGHRCSKKCSDECNFADCTERVIIETRLICGHKSALVPCNLQTKSNVFVRYCMQECRELLDCEHTCSGTCGQCFQGRIHKACEQDCGRPLICGHSCTVPCSSICPPCGKQCTQKCAHSQCPRKCGEICAPCNEPCVYNCAHFKCKKRCSEICDRPRCYEPCKKRLRCSHQCVGFCGEPCPPCKVCQPEHFEIFFGTEDEDDARFVKLEECGHVFESSGLEQWFESTPDTGEITQKTCPQCKSDVVRTQRFMDLIKPVMKNIIEVKQILFGKQEELHKQRQQLQSKLKEHNFLEDPQYAKFTGYSRDSDELYSLHRKLQGDLPLIKNNRRNEIGTEKARLLGFMVEFVSMIIDKYKKCWKSLNEESKLKIYSKTNFIVSLLKERNIKISVQEINSFVLELNRLMSYIDLKMIVSTPGFAQCVKSNTEAQRLFERASKYIKILNKFSDDVNLITTENLDILRKLVGSSNKITDEERKMIIAAMGKYCVGGSAVGHFFKCGNGHIYCITECGGATQRSRCPVDGCGLIIGGENHRLVEGQRLASEMDGARHAAWSSGNDMNNYQL